MKRRTFLTAASTVGIVGVASSATVASSVYNNLSLSILLEEFDDAQKSTLDKFVADVTENAKNLGIDASYVRHVSTPVQIMSKKSVDGNKTITYKNKAGQTVLLSAGKGVRIK